MKLFAKIVAAVIITAFSSCSGNEHYPTTINKVGEPADSLTDIIEWKFNEAFPVSLIQKDFNKLKALADANPQNEELAARVAYWTMRIEEGDNPDALSIRLETAREIAEMHVDARWRTVRWLYAIIGALVGAVVTLLLRALLKRKKCSCRLRKYVKSELTEVETSAEPTDEPSRHLTELQRQLLDHYPALSETELKLACLIARGNDKHEIAQALGIRPESVKQARWRLRQRLALQADQNLDELLQQLAQQLDDPNQ